MKNEKIFVVVPAFNEEKKIKLVVTKLKEKYNNIVVVDDCSQDSTWNIIAELDVIAVRHILNRGQGAALETGDRVAVKMGADIIVHFDADDQFKVGDIEKFISALDSGDYDIVFGTRFMKIESNMPKFKKFVIMPLARLIVKKLYGVYLTDPQNGFRAFTKKYAEKLEIKNDGSAHCTEILAHTLNGGWRFKEVPVFVVYDKFGQGIFGGKGRGSGGIRILKSLFIQKLIR